MERSDSRRRHDDAVTNPNSQFAMETLDLRAAASRRLSGGLLCATFCGASEGLDCCAMPPTG